jgi:hypothetical protein
LILQHKNLYWLRPEAFQQNTYLALSWLLRSHQVTNHQGFAAYYQKRPWRKGKWSNAYPETSGYIIETLFDYATFNHELALRKIALQTADWLVSIQMESGAFQGGIIGDAPAPSVFNTGMILFGLNRANKESENNSLYLNHLTKALGWLSNCLDTNGNWDTGGMYVKGFNPTYYTRVLWSMLIADKNSPNQKVKEKITTALTIYKKRIDHNVYILKCSFFPNKPALTHTIAYSLRGFLECSLLLKDDILYSLVKSVAKKLAHIILEKKAVAGTYDSNWKANYNFICLTGNAQLSIIFLIFFEIEQDILFYEAALIAFNPIVKNQVHSGNKDIIGAISGSAPIWGLYYRFRYPNWAVKFYLDAYLLFYKLSKNTA